MSDKNKFTIKKVEKKEVKAKTGDKKYYVWINETNKEFDGDTEVDIDIEYKETTAGDDVGKTTGKGKIKDKTGMFVRDVRLTKIGDIELEKEVNLGVKGFQKGFIISLVVAIAALVGLIWWWVASSRKEDKEEEGGL